MGSRSAGWWSTRGTAGDAFRSRSLWVVVLAGAMAVPVLSSLASWRSDAPSTALADGRAAVEVEREWSPPGVQASDDLVAAPTFTPFTKAPRLRSREAVDASLQQEYNRLEQDRSVRHPGSDRLEGTAHVWLFHRLSRVAVLGCLPDHVPVARSTAGARSDTSYVPSMLRSTKPRFAGRSARRRTYHGNHASP